MRWAVLEIIIGVAFVYLLFSIVCSSVNEWAARWMNWRGKMLLNGINELLCDPAGKGLAQAFHQHPLIMELRKRPVTSESDTELKKKPVPPKSEPDQRYPSYIQPSTFALALMSLIYESDLRVKDSVTLLAQADGAGVAQPGKVPLTARQKMLANSLKQGTTNALTLKSSIERWFEGGMERVSGQYKRKAQLYILFIAFLVAAFFNIDTVKIARELNHNDALREGVTTRVRKIYDSANNVSDINVSDEIAALKVPLGWSSYNSLTDLYNGAKEQTFSAWFSKVIGIFLTTVALSLGAPFWFDLLNKLVNLRQTGLPPDEVRGIVAQ